MIADWLILESYEKATLIINMPSVSCIDMIRYQSSNEQFFSNLSTAFVHIIQTDILISVMNQKKLPSFSWPRNYKPIARSVPN